MSKEDWEYENEINSLRYQIKLAENAIQGKMNEVKVCSRMLAIAELKLKELKESEE